MGRQRKAGKYPYDYTAVDDVRFADSGLGGTLRVLHGPGRGMGVTDGTAGRWGAGVRIRGGRLVGVRT